jgi:sugar phosphate isomerase/epimerase
LTPGLIPAIVFDGVSFMRRCTGMVVLWAAAAGLRAFGGEAPNTNAATQPPAAKATAFKGPVGLQLRSLRRELSQDLPAALARVRAYGLTNVEVADVYGVPAQRLRAELDKAGLKCPSMFISYERLQEDLIGVGMAARALGAAYVVVDGIPHEDKFTAEDCQRGAADLNRWGEALKTLGLRLAYHVHGYEFQPAGNRTLFDGLVVGTKPEFVSFELDVFGAARAGRDPAQLLDRYPTRFPLVHLKDMKKGTARGVLTGEAPEDASVALGAGELDLRAILRQAADSAVKHYFIEDESPEAAANIPASLSFLEQVRF